MRAYHSEGLTLIELLLVFAVLAIVVTSGLPTMRGLIDRQQLRGAANDLHAEFLSARMEAIRRNEPVSVAFTTGAEGDWCMALSDRGPCDCLEQRDCTLAGAPPRITGSESFRRVSVTTNFTPRNTATFRPARGTANAGTARLRIDDQQVEIRLSTLGRVRVCSNDLGEYPSC